MVASLAVLVLLAGVIAIGLRSRMAGDDRTVVRWLVAPTWATSLILAGLFAAFIVFLTLDSLSLYEAVWKPIILPLSFLLFLPVWVLYVATFPLAVVFSIVGFHPSPMITLPARGIVLAVGFPLSAVFQALVVSISMGKHDAEAD